MSIFVKTHPVRRAVRHVTSRDIQYPIRAARPCRQCLFQLLSSPKVQSIRHLAEVSSSSRHRSILLERRFFNDSSQLSSTIESAHGKIIEAARVKVEAYRLAVAKDVTDSSVDEQKARAQVLKDVGPLAAAWESYQNLQKAIRDVQPHLSDPDPTLREMFESESTSLQSELDNLLANLLPRLLLPPLPTSHLPTVISVNAGTGGAEAALFAEELVRMYTLFAEKRGWKVEVLSRAEGQAGSKGGNGGLRETTMRFEPDVGDGGGEAGGEEEVYGLMKWERGVHRVQRVPATETQSRIHTSTAAVVILPIYPETPDEPLFDIKDVKQEVMRASGAGGQHVNRTESAVRLTHIPTGISVSMQDSRSQHQNKAWAWEVLRARLSEKKHDEDVEARRATRRSQVKGADRSDKIRTYNFPQDRLTDHRIGFTVNGLRAIMEGDDLELVIGALKKDLEERRLESLLLDGDDIDY